MKILQVVRMGDGHLGGAELYVCRISELLTERGHRVEWVIPENATVPAALSPYRVWTIPVARGMRTSRKAWMEFQRILEEATVDLAILHNTVGFLTPWIIGALHRTLPTIKQVHDARAFCPRATPKMLPVRSGAHGVRHCELRAGWRCVSSGCLGADRNGPIDVGSWREHGRETLLRLGELRILRTLPAVLSYSEYVKRELVRNGVHEDRIHVVGQCLRWSRSQILTKHEAKRSFRKIGAVGRWDSVKGLGLFLDVALERLRELSVDVEIVGGGPLLAQAQARVRAAGAEDRIRIWGYVDSEAMRLFYQRINVLVVPSLTPEAFCAAGIEAQAHGVAVIGFDSGAVNEWLRDRIDGRLLPVGDASALEAAILELLEDPATVRDFGRQGQERALERYNSAAHLEPLERLFESIVAGRGTGSRLDAPEVP